MSDTPSDIINSYANLQKVVGDIQEKQTYSVLTAISDISKTHQEHNSKVIQHIDNIVNPKSSRIKNALSVAFILAIVTTSLAGVHLTLDLGNTKSNQLRERGAALLTGAFASIAGLLASTKF
jgi:hypothetical protein